MGKTTTFKIIMSDRVTYYYEYKLTAGLIGDREVSSLSESLKSNTTLVVLDLNREDNRKNTHKRRPSTIHFFLFLFSSTDNKIGETGATSLSESLKSNTTLIELYLLSEEKRKKTHKRHPSTIHFFLTTSENKIGDTGASSLSESLKSNTTLTKLVLHGEGQKKTLRRHPSINYSFPLNREQYWWHGSNIIE